MDLDSSVLITEAVGKIENITKGSAFIEILDNTCLAGIIVKGIKYDEEPVYEIISKLQRSLFLKSFDHLLVGDKVICFRLDLINRMSDEEIEEMIESEFVGY